MPQERPPVGSGPLLHEVDSFRLTMVRILQWTEVIWPDIAIVAQFGRFAMSTCRRLAPFLTLAALMLLTLGGCKAQKEQKMKVIFYPPPPDAPRLQFLTSFSSAKQWLKSRSSFADFIVGGKKEEDETAIKSPYGIAARDGKLYICDLGASRVHVIDIQNKSYKVLAPTEQTPNPVNITIDSDGTKYVCDTAKRRVVVYDADDQFVRDIGDPKRCVPIDLAIWDDKLFVADIAAAEVEVWTKDGSLIKTISSKGLGPSQLLQPTNLEVGQNGHVYVVDSKLAIVKEFDQDGKFVKSFGEPGDRPGFFARPKGIAIDPEGRLYVADAQWEVIQIFAPDGRLLLYFRGAEPGPTRMGLPAGVAIDKTSLPAFRHLVSENFEPEYLFLVANQFGVNKIGVYAFGHAVQAKPVASQPKQEAPPPADD